MEKRVHRTGIDPTSARSAGECLAFMATEAWYSDGRKKTNLKIKMKIGPTFWSHSPTFRGDLVKTGRESKCEENNTLIGNRSDVLPIRRQALYALGRSGFMLSEGKIT